jgi:phage/plasmid-like protein (TIGR03299 family)
LWYIILVWLITTIQEINLIERRIIMSHEVETMAYVGEKPWHGLGNLVNPGIDVEGMLVESGLNWNVRKEQLTSESGITLDTHYALIRDTDNKSLGICGKEYIPTQNSEAFAFFDSFVKAGKLKLETAGSLFGGKKVFGLAKTNFGFDLKNDRTEDYILLYSPHIWGKSLSIMHTSIRVVCNNTLTQALKTVNNNSTFRFLHNVKFDAAMQELAAEKLAIVEERSKQRAEIAQLLASTKVSEEVTDNYFKKLFKVAKAEDIEEDDEEEQESNKIITLKELVYTQPGAELESSKGTMWGLFNSVTFYTDHVVGRIADNRIDNALFGKNATLKNKALNLAIEMAKAA